MKFLVHLWTKKRRSDKGRRKKLKIMKKCQKTFWSFFKCDDWDEPVLDEISVIISGDIKKRKGYWRKPIHMNNLRGMQPTLPPQSTGAADDMDSIPAVQSMDWLFKKERIYLLAQFWQQVSKLYCDVINFKCRWESKKFSVIKCHCILKSSKTTHFVIYSDLKKNFKCLNWVKFSSINCLICTSKLTQSRHKRKKKV